MREVVRNTLMSEAAQEASLQGWSLDEIRDRICVDCGSLNLPDYSASGMAVPAKMDGRKIGYRKNGTRYDAGYICGDCMK